MLEKSVLEKTQLWGRFLTNKTNSWVNLKLEGSFFSLLPLSHQCLLKLTKIIIRTEIQQCIFSVDLINPMLTPQCLAMVD